MSNIYKDIMATAKNTGILEAIKEAKEQDEALLGLWSKTEDLACRRRFSEAASEAHRAIVKLSLYKRANPSAVKLGDF